MRTWAVVDRGPGGVIARDGVRPKPGECVEVIELEPVLDLLERIVREVREGEPPRCERALRLLTAHNRLEPLNPAASEEDS